MVGFWICVFVKLQIESTMIFRKKQTIFIFNWFENCRCY